MIATVLKYPVLASRGSQMYEHLETAANPEKLKRVVIDPVTRVEGHGKVTLLLDEENHVKQARLHIVEFRGFERFIQGRPYWELPVLVQRLCGICPVSHHLAAAKAVDQLVGGKTYIQSGLKPGEIIVCKNALVVYNALNS